MSLAKECVVMIPLPTSRRSSSAGHSGASWQQPTTGKHCRKQHAQVGFATYSAPGKRMLEMQGEKLTMKGFNQDTHSRRMERT